jgi:hypothetical protein
MSWLTQIGAQKRGADLPWQGSGKQDDVDANQQGIDNANKYGPQVSCVETCRGQFQVKVKNECCTQNPPFKKGSEYCCML